jgi:membrane protease YdiL (CAAX protease family)
MNASQPPRPDSPDGPQPLARPAHDPFAPGRAPFIPVARPVSPELLTYVLPQAPGRRRAFFELILLVPVGFAGMIAGFVIAYKLGVRDDRWLNLMTAVGMGIGLVLGIGFFLHRGGEQARDIGLSADGWLLNIILGPVALLMTYIAAFSILIAAMLVFPSILDYEPQAHKVVREMMPDMRVAGLMAFMLFVAVWEEVVFRGFVLTRLHRITGRWWIAVPVSAALFASVHGYEGGAAMIMIFVLGVVLALLFLWRRSLVPCMSMHFIHNTAVLLLLRSGLFDI